MARGVTSNPNWKEIAEIIGVTAIVASLVFVGIELRQARQIAIADMYQQRSSMLIDLHAARLSSEPLTQSMNKMDAGEALGDWESGLVNTAHYLFLTYWENIHFQFEYGLMPEEQWQASQRAMANYLRTTPGAMDFWNSAKLAMRVSFVNAVEEVIADN